MKKNEESIKLNCLKPNELERDNLVSSGLHYIARSAYEDISRKWVSLEVLQTNEQVLSQIHQGVMQVLNFIIKMHRPDYNVHSLDQHYRTSSKARKNFLQDYYTALSVYKQKLLPPEKMLGQLLNATRDVYEQHKSKNFIYKSDSFSASEKQLNAYAKIYAVDLILTTLPNKDILDAVCIMSDLYRYHNFSLNYAVYGRKGGKSPKREKEVKAQAWEIFLQKCDAGDKEIVILVELEKSLAEVGIKVSQATLKTSWIPEFKRRKEKTSD